VDRLVLRVTQVWSTISINEWVPWVRALVPEADPAHALGAAAEAKSRVAAGSVLDSTDLDQDKLDRGGSLASLAHQEQGDRCLDFASYSATTDWLFNRSQSATVQK
jgi:hypothetical protein